MASMSAVQPEQPSGVLGGRRRGRSRRRSRPASPPGRASRRSPRRMAAEQVCHWPLTSHHRNRAAGPVVGDAGVVEGKVAHSPQARDRRRGGANGFQSVRGILVALAVRLLGCCPVPLSPLATGRAARRRRRRRGRAGAPTAPSADSITPGRAQRPGAGDAEEHQPHTRCVTLSGCVRRWALSTGRRWPGCRRARAHRAVLIVWFTVDPVRSAGPARGRYRGRRRPSPSSPARRRAPPVAVADGGLDRAAVVDAARRSRP